MQALLRRLGNLGIVVLINLIGAILFSLIGVSIGFLAGFSVTGILCGIIAWIGIYVILGFVIVGENDFLLTERLGEYHQVIRKGWDILCLPGIIDKVVEDGGRGDFKWHRIDLFSDEKKNKIDFTDGSAEVKAQVWYRIKNTNDDVYRWVYTVDDSPRRIEEITDGTIRPLLQKESIDEASINMQAISQTGRTDPGMIQSLADMGVELDPHKGIIVTDIKLPKTIEDDREETLKGKRAASRQAAQGAGYALAIRAIIEEAAKSHEIKDEKGNVIQTIPGRKISWKQAVEIYEKQRGLETLEKKTGAMNFVSHGLSGVLVSMDISQTPDKAK
jgi:regulator of protease activity HflC (stomatin/prohibitin superfamily)